jgi:hypothetical protein
MLAFVAAAYLLTDPIVMIAKHALRHVFQYTTFSPIVASGVA